VKILAFAMIEWDEFMTDSNATFSNIGDDQVIDAINRATRSLVIVAPGLSRDVAEAIVRCWRRIGAVRAKVILDVDPEVCRLGYGNADAVNLLQTVAAEIGVAIHHQSGVRICLVVSDDSTLIFSPTPLVVEAKARVASQPNGLRLDFVPNGIANEVGLGDRGRDDQTVGLKSVSSNEVKEVLANLTENPPRKFDLTQLVQVFNAAFEFVDFTLKGCSISRKTVRIPSDLVGLGRDPRTQKMLRSTFKLIDAEDKELSGARITRLKRFINDNFLVNLPNYGNIVLRKNKTDFERAVDILRRYVDRFQRRLEVNLQSGIDRNRRALVEALASGVANNPPPRSRKHLGPTPSREVAAEWLDLTLKGIFGDAAAYLKRMRVKVIVKGVTYESLSDATFIEVAKKHLPSLNRLHDEFDVAKAVSEEPKRQRRTLLDSIDESSKSIN
jgi:hypothetical protein